MELTRIHPDPGRIGVAEAATALRQDGRPHDGRPHVALNFAATLDGRITIGGRSGPIGNEVDRELFHELRAQVDAVMVGAGTAGTERYGRLVRDPDRRERRQAAGLDPDPLAVVVSARLSLDAELPLLQDEHSRVVVITEADADKIKDQLANGVPVNVTVSPSGFVPLVGSMVSSSSRGPSVSFNAIKPDICAPGAR